VERCVRLAFRMGHMAAAVFGRGFVVAASGAIRALTGEAVPLWTSDVPRPAGRRPRTSRHGVEAVYFPACIARVMGRLPGEPDDMSAMQAFVRVAERAGVPVFIPRDAPGVCCGVPFSSKGYDPAHEVAVNRAIERFWRWSEGGRLPVVIDTTTCTYGLRTCRRHLTEENRNRFDQLRILDSIEFVHDVLLPKLDITRRQEAVALHPVCSLIKLSLAPKLEAVAQACSETAAMPRSAGCCGFAGDRGFLFPELTEAATRAEAAEVKAGDYNGHYSSSRTCEIGMTRATGRVYRSYIHLVEQASRPA